MSDDIRPPDPLPIQPENGNSSGRGAVEPADPTLTAADGAGFGRYAIIEEIGRGGMGVVYRARDEVLGRDVALKTILPDARINANRRKRLLREARAASKLAHPGIVPVFEVFDHDGVPWIAMQYIDGVSLDSVLALSGPPPIGELLEQQASLASALHAAHANGVLHRDVKPSNVLIDRNGSVRLTDFGLARQLAGFEDSVPDAVDTLTAEGLVIGTLPYMSPEQVLGRKLDERSDIFSLGALFFQMTTGRRPFEGSTDGEIIDAVLHHQPSPISHPTQTLPPQLKGIIERCLEKEPRNRYQNAGDLASDLRMLMRGNTSMSGRRLSRITMPRSRNVAIVAVSVIFVLATVALIGWWRNQSRTRLPRFGVRQVTDHAGLESTPAVSPNGLEIAYTRTEERNTDIWLVDRRGGTPLRLTSHTATDRDPAWYPDGSALAFVSTRGGHEAVWRVSRFGGGPELVLDGAMDPSISPDGKSLAFSQRDASGIQRIGVAQLSDPVGLSLLTGPDDGLWDHRHPAWSPSGDTLVYEDFRNLWLVPVTGGPAQPFTADDPPDREPAWAPDGRHIYFSSAREGVRAIWRKSKGGEFLERVTTGTGFERAPSLSADGRLLVYATHQLNASLEIVDRSTNGRARLHDARHMSQPVISPDGSALVFASGRESALDLWKAVLVNGKPAGEPERLTRNPGSGSNPNYSPDGRWVAYHRVLEGRRDLWVVSASGGLPVQITDHPANDVVPDWSPDGRRLAFSSDRSGSHQLWVLGIEEGAVVEDPRQITDLEGNAIRPVWSPDGQKLAFIYQTERERDVWLADTDGRAPPRRLTTQADPRYLRWTTTGDGIMVSGYWGGERATIRSVSPAGGALEPVLDLELSNVDAEISGFDLSRDGRFVVLSAMEYRGDVWELESESGAF